MPRTLRLLCLLVCLLTAAAVEPPVAERMLEDLRAANVARSALAGESAAWSAERERLEAALDALQADGRRLAREADAAEAMRDRAVQDLAALGAGGDLEPVQAILAASAARVRERLTALARELPPGAMSEPRAGGEGGFDEALRALEASERALEKVAVEIVPGRLGERTIAVKALRVGGAAAWWLAMDGAEAGTLGRQDGQVVLTALPDAATRDAIARAIAIVEQRQPAAVELLPLPGAAP